jgi:hypothetical protein
VRFTCAYQSSPAGFPVFAVTLQRRLRVAGATLVKEDKFALLQVSHKEIYNGFEPLHFLQKTGILLRRIGVREQGLILLEETFI